MIIQKYFGVLQSTKMVYLQGCRIAYPNGLKNMLKVRMKAALYRLFCKMKKKHIWKKRILCAVCLGMIGAALLLSKVIRINPCFAAAYEVRGVDVSHYQGAIDWEKLAAQDVDFAFIKATEGSGHVDECFYDNWQAAAQTELCIGAYHFFSFDSRGQTQAGLFIDTVGDLTGKLAPVIDIEYYGDKEKNPPSKEAVKKELGDMLEILEAHYQTKPIIYTTGKVYKRYMEGEFEEYPLWIRGVYYPPVGKPGKKWTFWQYTDRAKLDGYSGQEEYIDMNVFRGNPEELKGGLL